MTYLPDVNVWIAVAIAGHVHHPITRHWFDRNADRLAPRRITAMGILRLFTDARLMDGAALVTFDKTLGGESRYRVHLLGVE